MMLKAAVTCLVLQAAVAVGPGGLGPAWTRGEAEQPLGEKDMGGWTAAVYTAEQQVRLGVDEMGSPTEAPVSFYRAQGSQNCPTAEMVTTEAECRLAGAAHGHPFAKTVNQDATAFNGAGRPAGCFWDQNGHAYFNENLSSSAQWAGVGGLCRRKASPTPRSAYPTRAPGAMRSTTPAPTPWRCSYTQTQRSFVKWGTCSASGVDPRVTCSALGYNECKAEAINDCDNDSSCVAVAVKKIDSDGGEQRRVYLKYSDSSCVKAQRYSDGAWDLYTKSCEPTSLPRCGPIADITVQFQSCREICAADQRCSTATAGGSSNCDLCGCAGCIVVPLPSASAATPAPVAFPAGCTLTSEAGMRSVLDCPRGTACPEGPWVCQHTRTESSGTIQFGSGPAPTDGPTGRLVGAWTFPPRPAEAARGTKNMGTWTAAVYTAEQQERLHVSETGERLDDVGAQATLSPSLFEAMPKSLSLLSKPGSNNYANCDGKYVLDVTVMINGKPIYINAEKKRFVGWSGRSWVLTATSYQSKIAAGEIASPFGGFHSALNGEEVLEASTWAEYNVVAEVEAEVAEMESEVNKNKREGHGRKSDGCYLKPDGLWCPQADGSWVNRDTGKMWSKDTAAKTGATETWATTGGADEEGCYKKDDGRWCPDGEGWINTDTGETWSEDGDDKVEDGEAWTKQHGQCFAVALVAGRVGLFLGLLMCLAFAITRRGHRASSSLTVFIDTNFGASRLGPLAGRSAGSSSLYEPQVDTVGADAAAAPPEYTADDAVPPPYTTDEPQPPQYTEGAAAPPAYSDAV